MNRLLLSAALVVVAASTAAAAGKPESPDAGSIHTRCATPEPSAAEAAAVQARIGTMSSLRTDAASQLRIPVAFHVITCQGEGNVPQSQIDDQVRELNRAYRGTGFSFELASVDRTENCHWFRKLTGPGSEKQMKQVLAIDPAHRLNVYTAALGKFLLGWAYFPQSFPEDSYLHGVVLHYGTLPGGFLAPYNLGGTLDHEAGHYLGLFHTFQGGCTDPGDFVDDTPFEAGPAFGCPIGRNTCPQPGDDPIHNYMDYTDDACYTELTADQSARMDAIVAAYRPSLGGALATSQPLSRPSGEQTLARAASTPAGLEFRGASPTPFADETTLRFALPRSGEVSLKLYNLAGQEVAVLVDGVRAGGEQSVSLRSGTLPPGMYFAALRFGGEMAMRRVILVP